MIRNWQFQSILPGPGAPPQIWVQAPQHAYAQIWGSGPWDWLPPLLRRPTMGPQGRGYLNIHGCNKTLQSSFHLFPPYSPTVYSPHTTSDSWKPFVYCVFSQNKSTTLCFRMVSLLCSPPLPYPGALTHCLMGICGWVRCHSGGMTFRLWCHPVKDITLRWAPNCCRSSSSDRRRGSVEVALSSLGAGSSFWWRFLDCRGGGGAFTFCSFSHGIRGGWGCSGNLGVVGALLIPAGPRGVTPT